ncbi:hypothetical protein LUW76_27720 [Actinomadura madurae]|uniref:hypothetical protein n=1 Tax=Actinomadura madurae TaxID=1993 RepID=UPI002026E20C|nr:hypothetical protein [Actinomadura madurae]URM97851.1 hypothetical protein LUW76_27720 [Actinomadura madurae]
MRDISISTASWLTLEGQAEGEGGVPALFAIGIAALGVHTLDLYVSARPAGPLALRIAAFAIAPEPRRACRTLSANVSRLSGG